MSITLVQLTDTHIHDQPLADFKGTQPDLYLHRIIRHMQQAVKHIDALVLTGDITHDGGAAACQQLAKLLAVIDCPIYLTLGNHDDTEVIKQHLLGKHISMPDRIDMGSWQLLFADSHIESRTSGRIDSATIEQINRQLLEHAQPALLFTHHPPLKINSEWMDEIGMENGDDLLASMARHPHLRAIIFGHIHQHWDSQQQHLRLLGTPSTCVQFKPLSEDFGIDNLDPGYRIFELHEGALHTRVLRCPMQIRKIISGGQTGVDRAALDSAIELAIPHGGWCPRGRLALDGPLDKIYQLQETPSAAYPQRTEWNIRDTDATLILAWGQPDGGTALTAKLAREMEKPLLVIDLCQPLPVNEVWHWLQNHNIRELNIAGPRHTKADGIYTRAREYLIRILCFLT